MEKNTEKGEKLEEIRSLLEKFTNAHGISGFEGEVRKLLEKELEPMLTVCGRTLWGTSSLLKRAKVLL